MSVAKTVIRNVAANWFGFAVNLAVMFFLTPFVISHIGTEAYGVWLVLQGIVGYYGFVDMGLRAGMVQTITRHIANKDEDAVVRHFSTALPVLMLLGLSVVLLAGVVGLVVPLVIDITPDLRSLVLPVLVVQAIAFSLQLGFAPFGAVLIGMQRFDIENIFVVISRLTYAAAMVVTLEMGGGLLGIALVGMSIGILDGILRYVRARYMLPALRRIHWRYRGEELHEMWKFGLWNTMVHAGRQLIFFSDVIVIALLFTPAAVVPFGIAGSIIDRCNKLVTLAVRVLFPAMAHLRSADDLKTQQELYLTATRLIAGVSLSILICGYFFISPFLNLWLGNTPARDMVLAESPMIFLILASASVFVGLHRAGSQLLIAHGRLQRVAAAYFLEGIANLVISIVLGFQFGVIGVAIGTLLPACVVAILFHLPAHAAVLEMSFSSLLKSLLLRPVLYAVVLGVLMLAVSHAVSDPRNWLQLGVAVAISASVIMGLSIGILLPRSQRIVIFSMLRTRPRAAA